MQLDRRVAVAASLGAMLSVQGGAAFAKHLFPLVGPDGSTLLRIGLAALILLAVFRPRLRAFGRTQGRRVLLYGLALAAMNVTFFHALRLVPLGVAVTVEFVGPLGLALVLSRRAVDVLWAVLAAAGVVLIVPWAGTGGAGFLGIGLAALIGFAVLHEVLRPVQLVAMVCVIVASVGSTLTVPAKTP